GPHAARPGVLSLIESWPGWHALRRMRRACVKPVIVRHALRNTSGRATQTSTPPTACRLDSVTEIG
ncbi:MAG: hypothetical protein ACRD36_04840, partial [Candidatus Acidiferrum sp.]